MTDDAKWELWKQMAKELGESTTLNASRRAVAGQLYKTLEAIDFKPERSSMDPGLTNTELPYEPQFDHDCDGCVFLGPFTHNESKFDLYYCAQHRLGVPTVLARYGSEGPEYTSGLEAARLQVTPSLAEARKRAIAKKLLKG